MKMSLKINFNPVIKILIALVFVIAIINLFHHIMDSDEGVILNGAWKIYNGERIYQDFFEYIAPGSFYLIALVFKIFSPTYFFARFISVLFFLVSAFLLYFSFLKLKNNKGLAISVAGLWLLLAGFHPLINHNSFSSFFAILFLYLMLSYIQTKNNNYIFFAGIVSAIVFYFLQTKGLAVIASTLLFLIYTRDFFKRSTLYFLGGIICVFAPAYLVWGDYIYSNLLIISNDYIDIHNHFYNWNSFLMIAAIIIIFYAIKKYRYHMEIVFLTILQFFLMISILNLPDYAHVLINSFPVVIIAIFLLNDLHHSTTHKNFLQSAICFFLLAVTFLLFYQKGFPSNITRQNISSLKDELVGKSFYARPFWPSMLFELGRKNPYYSSVFETEISSHEVLEKNYQVFLRENPDIVMTNYEMVRKYGYRFNKIDNYIFHNYKIKREECGILFWEKK
jgi:hypothetical protein